MVWMIPFFLHMSEQFILNEVVQTTITVDLLWNVAMNVIIGQLAVFLASLTTLNAPPQTINTEKKNQ